MRPTSTQILCLLLGFMSMILPSNSLNPLVIKGYKFFDSVTGEEVIIKGIDYYPRPNQGDLNHNSVDYFTQEHSHIWKRDIPFFQELGVNAIRLYAVNHTENHDAFMCALDAAGIYVVVALAHDCPTCAITRDNAVPTGQCYPPELKEQGQLVINNFAKYPNTLAFSAGNEVNHFAPIGQPQWNAPCQKKFIRDMRAYLDSCSNTLRRVPVGLVAADSDREVNTLYYNCQEDSGDPFEYAEWFGLNSYVHCSNVTHYKDAVGLQALQKSFEAFHMSIPVLLTEFGCLSPYFPTVDGYQGQRTFLQAKWMLTEPSLHELFAGGFAFEYSIEAANAAGESPFPFTKFGKQNYGIGYFSPENCDDVKINCKYHPTPTFALLQKAYATHNHSLNTTTLDDFHISELRQNRSVCPPNFPKLSSIQWDADKHPFRRCPSRAQTKLTCPAIDGQVVVNPTNNATHGLVGQVLMAFLMLVCTLLAVRGIRQHWGQRGDYQKLQQVIISTDSTSDDSTGFVALTGFPNTVKTQYQAIESDSGSEENSVSKAC